MLFLSCEENVSLTEAPKDQENSFEPGYLLAEDSFMLLLEDEYDDDDDDYGDEDEYGGEGGEDEPAGGDITVKEKGIKLASLYDNFQQLDRNIETLADIIDSLTRLNCKEYLPAIRSIQKEVNSLRESIDNIFTMDFSTEKYSKLLFLFTSIKINVDIVLRMLESIKKEIKDSED